MTEKAKFLKELNEAFAKNDTAYIADQVTDDIQWTVHGDFTIQGKGKFLETLKEMEAAEPFELNIEHIITHGKTASVNGVMKTPDGKSFAFCDVYLFNGFKNPKIKEMSSYVVEK